MKKIQIGTSGIETSAIGLGTWAIGGGAWWGDNNDSESIKTIRHALDSGIQWVDTAPVYNMGHSEDIVGKALQDGYRQKAILSTKCGLIWDRKSGSYHELIEGKEVYRDLSPASIRQGLEESLIRLKTDYIDVFFTHWQSIEPEFTPIEETMGELMKLKQEGKIRAIGASNVQISHLEQYIKNGELDVIQEKYSMLDRRLETEILPYCDEHHISVQAYSPLEQGLLTGTVTMETVLRPEDVRFKKRWWNEGRAGVLAMLDGWKDLCEKYHCTIGNLVIAWTIRRGNSMNVLCGARKVEQVMDNVKGGQVELEQADYERMTQDADRLIAQLK